MMPGVPYDVHENKRAYCKFGQFANMCIALILKYLKRPGEFGAEKSGIKK